MAKSSNQKLKILYIMQMLLEQTDEEHVLSIQDIIRGLEAYGISAERKSIYDDLEALRHFGLDIEQRREKPVGYYLASREFELPELKLLVDIVQSSKFITAKKSDQLIQKIEGLAGRHQAWQLHRQVVVANRIKTMNESIYYNVDKIHSAISENVKIVFQYFEWTPEKKMELRKGGEWYRISPWALTWDDENYYLIGYDDAAEISKHYRVDKMVNISLVDEPREGQEMFQNFDAAAFSKRIFGMYGGREWNLCIRFDNRLIGVVIDRFGKEAAICPEDQDHFTVHVRVAVSNPFFGWLSGLGTGVRIVSPKPVARKYQAYLEALLKQYEE